MQQLKLGYWKGRGIAHPIRQLLHITGLNFEDFTYDTRPEWLAHRDQVFKGGENAPFGSLPWLIDGDFVLSESGAIPAYICEKAGKTELLGKTVKDRARVTQIQGVIKDLYAGIEAIGASNSGNRLETIQNITKVGSKVHTITKKLSEFLGQKQFFVGYFTYADLLVAHFILLVRNITLSAGGPDLSATLGGGNLLAHAKRVNALEELATFKLNYPYVLTWFIPWFKEHQLPQ